MEFPLNCENCEPILTKPCWVVAGWNCNHIADWITVCQFMQKQCCFMRIDDFRALKLDDKHLVSKFIS